MSKPYPGTSTNISDLARDDDDEPRAQSKPGKGSKGSGKKETHREHKEDVRPDEVSRDVWALTEEWIQAGRDKFGKRPPVNKVAFSIRFSERINSTRDLRIWMEVKGDPPDKRWAQTQWNSGLEFVVDVIHRMIRMFYDNLTEEQTRKQLQWAFLDEEWDEWVYQAVTSATVSEYQKNGTWTPSTSTAKPLDRLTLGGKERPERDDPCTDPNYEGMTWGEVWDLPSEPDAWTTLDLEPEPTREERTGLASRWAASIANRRASDTTTTEEQTDGS